MARILMLVAALSLLVYGGLCWFLYAKQRDLIYYGWTTQLPTEQTNFVVNANKTVLRGWAINPDKPNPILYFGGNAERIEYNREPFARMFPDRSVYLVAYRGYGATAGEPSEAVLIPDALAVFDRVQALHPGQKIAVIGRSLGTGIASQVAVQRAVERLALITPFDNMANAAGAHYPIFPVRWLLNERYESAKALRHFDKPTLIIQAGRDEVIPASSTERLIAALPQRPRVVKINDADHNNIGDNDTTRSTLADFMR